MFRKILGYGIAAGLIVGIPLSIITVSVDTGHGIWGMVIGYTTMLIALSTVFVAVKRHRDIDLGGVIGFWPALGMGLGISIIASIIYVIAWEATVDIAHIDFANGYAASQIAQEKAKGVSGAALARFIAEMDAFKKDYANPFYRWPMTFMEIFPVGVLVSLVTAGLLCMRRFMPARRA